MPSLFYEKGSHNSRGRISSSVGISFDVGAKVRDFFYLNVGKYCLGIMIFARLGFKYLMIKLEIDLENSKVKKYCQCTHNIAFLFILLYSKVL